MLLAAGSLFAADVPCVTATSFCSMPCVRGDPRLRSRPFLPSPAAGWSSERCRFPLATVTFPLAVPCLPAAPAIASARCPWLMTGLFSVAGASEPLLDKGEDKHGGIATSCLSG